MQSFSDALVSLGDFALGWLLYLPRDLAIVGVALLTSLALTLARKWLTDQDYLSRCASDAAILARRAREAARAGDREAVGRLRGLLNTIKLGRLGWEGRVVLAALVPVAWLAMWAFARLEFLPPLPGQPITVRAYYPQSAVGKLTRLAAPPCPGDGPCLELRTPAICRVRAQEETAAADQPHGVAEWVVAAPAPGDLEILIRQQGELVRQRLLVDGLRYAAPLQTTQGERVLAVEVVLAPAKFLGVLPGLPWIGVAPWMTAYLLLTLAFTPLLRYALWVY